jgi:hypothetical protein
MAAPTPMIAAGHGGTKQTLSVSIVYLQTARGEKEIFRQVEAKYPGGRILLRIESAFIFSALAFSRKKKSIGALSKRACSRD